MAWGLGRGVTGVQTQKKDEKESGRLPGRAQRRNKREGEERRDSGGGFLGVPASETRDRGREREKERSEVLPSQADPPFGAGLKQK